MDDPSPCSSISDQPNAGVSSTLERKASFNNRDRPKRLQIKLLPGQVAFRFLIHVSDVGRLLCNNGAVVSRIRRETSTRIHCEAVDPGSNLRVVLVVGFGSRDGRDVSSAQEAVLRVFESVSEKVGDGGRDVVCWKMLAHTSQVGAVMGRGGQNIRRVRTETGAQIRILPAPHWMAEDDELIQITGDLLAVKKALVDVSSSLQDCPPFDKATTHKTRPLEDSPYGASPESQAHLIHVSSSLPPPLPENSGTSTSHGDTSPLSLLRYAERVVSGKDKKGSPQQEVVFRMLCSYHAAGWVIGKRGAIVKALQNEAGASIMFAAPTNKSGERVVTISAWENLESSQSPAQNAVILVFTRMIEGVIERGSLSGSSEGRPVMAKLLVVSDLVGCLGGNDGKVLTELREVTGADIRIVEGEHILTCGSVNDTVVQITGDYKSVENALFQVTYSLRDNQLRAKYPYVRVSEDPFTIDTVPSNIGAISSPPRLQLPQITGSISAMKKALNKVSISLHDCSPIDKAPTPLTRSLGGSSYGSPDPHAELLQHLSSPLPPLPGNSGNRALNDNTSLPIHADVVVSGQDKKGTEQEVVFRMLCSNHAAGCVIGKRGAIVRALQNEAGASISFAAPLTESGERVVTISACENLESSHSPAQNAVGRVFARIIEGFIEKGFLSGLGDRRAVTAKLLVASDFVGHLSGNGGKLLSEMRRATDADIQILEGEHILNCVLMSDLVVQITGEFRSVQNALFQVTGSIRDHLLLSGVFREVTVKSPHLRLSEGPLRNEPVPHNISAPSSPKFQLPQTAGRGQTTAISDSEGGITTFSGDSELGSGKKLATVTATTVEIKISEHVFGSVYGEDGSNLDRIKQISGAKVKVHDPRPGEREGRVVISGTPDKTFAAQSLLHAFIQSAKKTPYN
ncbi:KH domain-containing protein HEN4-like isoform X1 [Juglans microcarpa x Juglans regia]|uniref:KH domain-containing protein HEN4-like isoform X1 n=1 Tax=Juglans microcarpa x Juglans regia TaxID=2249226 RepID=UPI001B7EF14E|nr:KH domain-containing protein HEN4-like isoform X1 [Juglans microcarpa x Juglans regia]